MTGTWATPVASGKIIRPTQRIDSLVRSIGRASTSLCPSWPFGGQGKTVQPGSLGHSRLYAARPGTTGCGTLPGRFVWIAIPEKIYADLDAMAQDFNPRALGRGMP